MIELRKPERLIALTGGNYEMGSTLFYPEEGPVHTVEEAPFKLDRGPVSNRQFAAFIHTTAYVTVSERVPDPAD